MTRIWKKEGFEGFSKGTFGNGGQNLYVSKAGVLQRIFNFDTTGNGYPDLPFANSQSMGERPDITVFTDSCDCTRSYSLPSNGSYDGLLADLNSNGYDDLVIACQNNGTHADGCAIIYFADKDGLSENLRIELPVPDGIGVAAGDFMKRGKKDLAFLSGGKLRIFSQNDKGFSAVEYKDIDISADGLTVCDINGDGYDDLYVKMSDGSCAVYFGGEDGIKEDSRTVFAPPGKKSWFGSSSTMSRRGPYTSWRPSEVCICGKKFLFRGAEKKAEFYTFDNGSIKLAFTFNIENSVYAVSGDFDGDGNQEIFIACLSDCDKTETSYILRKNGDVAAKIPTSAAVTAVCRDINADGRDELIIAQTSNSVMRTTASQTLFFDAELNIVQKKEFETGETMRVLVGKTCDGDGFQTVVINHETGRVRGDENTYIYIGGPDGYSEKNRTELPGWSAVDMLLADFNDDGRTDCLVSNCVENFPGGDPGSFLYINDGKGLRANNKIVVDTIRNHGTAIGDFTHSGYIDMACGGIYNREIRILHGGPWGTWDTTHMDRVVFGPDPEKYHPFKANVFEDPDVFTQEEAELNERLGENRWLFSADFNGDGWLDLFVTLVGSGYAYILWGGPEGFSLERSLKLNADGAISVTAADLNKNGYLDLIIGHHYAKAKKTQYETYISVYWGGSEGYSESRRMMLPVPCANSVTVGDFSHSGWLDIYATAYNNGRVRDLDSYLYINDCGKFSIRNRRRLFNHSGCGCIAGDFDGDGYTDLAVACHKDEGNHCGMSFIFHGGPDGLDFSRRTELPTVGPHGMSTVDPGNIADRSDSEYYYSEPFEIGAKSFVSIELDAEYTSTSHCEISYRYADSINALETSQFVPLCNKAEAEGFLQYRLALIARCGCGTPRIRAVTLTAKDI